MPKYQYITSQREKRLWAWLVVVLMGVASTIFLGATLSNTLKQYQIFEGLFVLGFFLMLVAIGALALKSRPGRYEIGILLGVIATYVMVLSRMGISPARAEERTHLFKYSIVAALIYELINERNHDGREVKRPGILAFAIAFIIGTIDELVQLVLPNRYFDLRDIGFNALAAFMAIFTIAALTWGEAEIRWETLLKY